MATEATTKMKIEGKHQKVYKSNTAQIAQFNVKLPNYYDTEQEE